jgi:hypothetical protein
MRRSIHWSTHDRTNDRKNICPRLDSVSLGLIGGLRLFGEKGPGKSPGVDNERR